MPLSPNWRLASDGTGVRLLPDEIAKVCRFEIVGAASDQSEGTVKGGDAKCPYPGCKRVIDGDEIKRQALSGGLGEQLFTVVFKKRIKKPTKTGRIRESWERGYRAPVASDDNHELIAATVAEKYPEWEAMNLVPTEMIGSVSNYDRGHRLYGMNRWSEMFSPRQLLCHVTSVEVFRGLLEEDRAAGQLDDAMQAAYTYLAFSLDKALNYGSVFCRWDITIGRVRSTFDTHGFSFVWSYAEMPLLVTGVGHDWAIEQTRDCIAELLELSGGAAGPQASLIRGSNGAPSKILCVSADALSGLQDHSVDAVVVDPPYYANVMYAELSDFFYVWLKRTAGYVYPEMFTRQLTDKENEAVANVAKFKDQKHPKALAYRDYKERMGRIFAECRRVLTADGILTVMFTHQETDAWDALASGLMEAGFTITASWPVNTESEGSIHIKEKAAAKTTIFLICRPRPPKHEDEINYWEVVEPLVGAAVRKRIEEFQAAGIRGVDLYLSCFGPAPCSRGQRSAI